MGRKIERTTRTDWLMRVGELGDLAGVRGPLIVHVQPPHRTCRIQSKNVSTLVRMTAGGKLEREGALNLWR
jgi:hypothetical protein